MCVSTVGVVQSKKHCRLDGGIPFSNHCPPMAPSPLPVLASPVSTRPSPSLSPQTPRSNSRRTKSPSPGRTKKPNRQEVSNRNPSALYASVRLCSARTKIAQLLPRLKPGRKRMGLLFRLAKKEGKRRRRREEGRGYETVRLRFALLRCVSFSPFALSDSNQTLLFLAISHPRHVPRARPNPVGRDDRVASAWYDSFSCLGIVFPLLTYWVI